MRHGSDSRYPLHIMRYTHIFLRLGLAFTFLYAAFAALIEPASWVGFYPEFLRNLLSETFLVYGFSAYEILIALWLLSGKKTLSAAALSAITLAGIVVFNFGALDIVFRDVGLFFAALALAADSRMKR